MPIPTMIFESDAIYKLPEVLKQTNSDPTKPVKIRDFGLPGQEPGATGTVPVSVARISWYCAVVISPLA